MVKSMTGYGRGEASDAMHSFTVEIRSVNNRYLDLSVRMPRQFAALEAGVRSGVQKQLSRGKVDVHIAYENTGESTTQILYQEEIAKQYYEHMTTLRETLGLPGAISVADLAGLPEVFKTKEERPDEGGAREVLQEALSKALAALSEAREEEGAFLKKDILAKLTEMEAHVAFISERASGIAERYRDTLKTKVEELLGGHAVDEARILQEVVIYADRTAVDEEVVRLQSHIEAVRNELEKKESIGRKLDFLAQEMNRESNTSLSKSDEAEVSERAVECKTLVEKIREQVQNIE